MTRLQQIQEFERVNRRFEKKFMPKVQRALHSQVKPVISILKESGFAEARQHLLNNVGNNEIAKVIKELYTTVGRRWAQLTYSRLLPETRGQKFNGFMFQTKGFGFNYEWTNFILNYLKQFLLDKVTFRIAETTRDALLSTLAIATASGMSIDQTVDQLEDWPYERFQAARIVRTETNRAANVGSTAQAETSKYEQQKEWQSADDNRVRGNPVTGKKDHADHWSLDGTKIDADDVFHDLRNGDQLMFPGDPKASAASTVNCFLPNEVSNIDLKFVKKAFRCFYKGEVVTVHLSTRNSFTCTPNHPILTSAGWVAAGELTNSHDLIKSDILNNRGVGELDINNVPSTFEEIFGTLNKSFDTFRAVPTGRDFYGDITTGDIDIIDTDSVLPNGFESFGIKSSQNNIFAHSNFRQRFLFSLSSLRVALYEKFGGQISNSLVSLTNKFSSFFNGGLRHSKEHSLASASLSNSGFMQPGNYRTSLRFYNFRNLFNAFTGIIKSQNSVNVDIFPICRNSFSGNNFNSISNKQSFYSKMITAESVGNFINIFPGFVKTDGIIKITTHNYEGDVYTLETNNQMYDINGYVARNCRCRASYTFKRDKNGDLIPKRRTTSVIFPGQARQRQVVTI